MPKLDMTIIKKLNSRSLRSTGAKNALETSVSQINKDIKMMIQHGQVEFIQRYKMDSTVENLVM